MQLGQFDAGLQQNPTALTCVGETLSARASQKLATAAKGVGTVSGREGLGQIDLACLVL